MESKNIELLWQKFASYSITLRLVVDDPKDTKKYLCEVHTLDTGVRQFLIERPTSRSNGQNECLEAAYRFISANLTQQIKKLQGEMIELQDAKTTVSRLAVEYGDFLSKMSYSGAK